MPMTDISLGVDDVEDGEEDGFPAFPPPPVPLLLFDLFFLAMVADCRLPSNGLSKQYYVVRILMTNDKITTQGSKTVYVL